MLISMQEVEVDEVRHKAECRGRSALCERWRWVSQGTKRSVKDTLLCAGGGGG
jgi:hypothetical protein